MSRPVIIQLLEGVKISPGEHKTGFHYYQARHSEADKSVPDTIEEGAVYANFWGTVVTFGPVDFNDGVYRLNKSDIEEVSR